MRSRLIQRRLELDPPMSREALAHKIEMHPKQVGRIERGECDPRPETRNRLARALQWTPGELALALADDDPEAQPGLAYRAPTVGLDMLSMLEQSCRQLRTLELTIIPGLLQTHAYAAVIERADPRKPDEAEVERRLAERLRRQQRAFGRGDPLRVFALLDPSVLDNGVGGPEVMADAIRHLNELPSVTVRLLSRTARVGAALGPFQLMTGDDPDPFMVITEDLSSGLSYRDGASVVGAHTERWRKLWSVSDELEEVDL